MQTNIPDSYLADAHELESKGSRDLFRIELRDGASTVLYFNPLNSVTYQGRTWDTLPCKLSDSAQNTTGEQSRPKFSVVNPDGVFSLWLQSGALNGAVLTRYRVMLPDIDANNAAFIRNLWIISKVLTLNKRMLTLELRSILDGANFMVPNRSFYPPDFPHVSLR